MRIVFAGTPDVAVPSLRSLVQAGHSVVAVITREDAPVGRKKVMTPSPVALAAEELGLSVTRTNRLTPEVTDAIAQLRPEVGVIVAYGGLVPQTMLDVPTHGWFNLHFSLLPRWRGAAPVQRSLMAADSQNGVTIFQLVAALDEGDVLSQRVIPLPATATAGDVLTHYAQEGAYDLVRGLEEISRGNIMLQPQKGQSSYAHKLTNADGQLDWTRPAALVIARYRGVTPEPGAYTEIAGQRVKVLSLQQDAEIPSLTAQLTGTSDGLLRPGQMILHRARVWVGTADDPVVLVRVQPSGKRAMDAADWFRGLSQSEVVAR
ncbi:methionyl-tRNA formyltransferase [Lysinibacter sp. HNR]|uniref:methionyl-tRNA formyltransferase n=1 Tax=Lysinibacter sp. HNR TaxID=3031408 RepID=UPI0024361373|nr:methionyl-tRNA formyltransferase [Lysinibacter sp. HNR]WGD36362.1 methionyl-tRNA formyltransferase [Lysinibacter sp. HNR]